MSEAQEQIAVKDQAPKIEPAELIAVFVADEGAQLTTFVE